MLGTRPVALEFGDVPAQRLHALTGSQIWPGRFTEIVRSMSARPHILQACDAVYYASTVWHSINDEADLIAAINAHNELSFAASAADAGTHGAREHAASDLATENQRRRISAANTT